MIAPARVRAALRVALPAAVPMLALLCGIARADVGAERLARYQSAHFALMAPAGLDVGTLLNEMERSYRTLRNTGLTLPAMVQARLYSSTSDFVRGSGASRFNLAYAQAEVMHLQPLDILFRNGGFSRALTHELAHVAMAKAARRGLPRWMNEGMAMAAAGEMLQEKIAFSRLRDLDDTLRTSRVYETVRSAYGTAGRLVHALITQYGETKVLSLLRSVAAGRDFATVFATLTGSSPDTWAKGELKR